MCTIPKKPLSGYDQKTSPGHMLWPMREGQGKK